MNWMKWMCVLAAASAVACQEAGKSGDVVTPPVANGKADSLGMHERGHLEFGDRAEGTFEADLQFETYTFFAGEGALVDIEVTQRGSSRGLDTTLFLYGPRDGLDWPASALMQDDDDGWGALSKLGNVEIYKEGFYLVVVGTADGQGRGTYGLELSCASGDCQPAVPTGTCHGIVEDTIRDCISYIYREGDLDDINVLVDECAVSATLGVTEEFFSWELGIDGAAAGLAYYRYFCDDNDYDFCRGETEATFTGAVMNACDAKLRVQDTFDPPTFESIDLDRDTIHEWQDLVYDECQDYCYFDAAAFRVTSGDQSLYAITKTLAVREVDVITPAAVYNTSNDGASILIEQFEVQGQYDRLIAELGLENAEYQEGVYSDAGQFYPSVDVTIDYYVRYFPDAGIALGLAYSTASE